MSPAAPTDEDSRRLALLGEFALGDVAKWQALEPYARLLQARSGWAMAILSFAGAAPRWIATDGPARPTRGRGFDLLALQEAQPLVIVDTRADPRCTSAAMATDAAHWPAYAGIALRVEGCAIGTLSVAHVEPRGADAALLQSLRDLAFMLEALLDARLEAARTRALLVRGGDAILAGSDWLWESDADGYMTWVSASAEMHTGEPASEEIGRLGRHYNAAPGEPYQASYEAYLRARAERRPFKDAIAARQTPRGRLLVSMSGRPVFDPDGRFVGYRGAARDVTADMARQQAADQERRAAEGALRDKRAAELASAAKSEFLSRMSHEMRTPLNAVIGFAQLLQMRSDAGQSVPVAQYSEHILQSGRHLLALVNDVLDLQQVETGRLNLAPEAVDLARALDTAWQMIEPAARARAIEMTGRLDTRLHVWADPRRLQQVLLNLLSNAVKYNRSGGWLRCSVETTGDERVVLVIEDAGEGLSADQLARLFQPLERLGRENSSVEGSGLGLVITRALVREMNGSLTMTSVPGQGSRVRVELPRPPAASALPPAVPGPVEASPASLRMLYVEDNPINALLFEEALKLRGGIDLRIAHDGPEALELLRDWHPDVLVLDAHLPSMSGYEVLHRLRQEPRFAATPAFMCSADALPDELQRAREAGFAGYWSKPIDIAQVMRELAAVSAIATSARPVADAPR